MSDYLPPNTYPTSEYIDVKHATEHELLTFVAAAQRNDPQASIETLLRSVMGPGSPQGAFTKQELRFAQQSRANVLQGGAPSYLYPQHAVPGMSVPSSPPTPFAGRSATTLGSNYGNPNFYESTPYSAGQPLFLPLVNQVPTGPFAGQMTTRHTGMSSTTALVPYMGPPGSGETQLIVAPAEDGLPVCLFEKEGSCNKDAPKQFVIGYGQLPNKEVGFIGMYTDHYSVVTAHCSGVRNNSHCSAPGRQSRNTEEGRAYLFDWLMDAKLRHASMGHKIFSAEYVVACTSTASSSSSSSSSKRKRNEKTTAKKGRAKRAFKSWKR